MKEYTIRLFTNGMGPKREKSRFTYLNFYGQPVDIPYIIWYVEGAEKKIIIDAGCSAEDFREIMKGGSKEKLTRGGETYVDVVDVTPLEVGLKKFDLTPEDVDVVILTHLHFDHVLGIQKFKNARVFVQEEEWKYVYNHHILMDPGFAPMWFYDRMRNLEFVKGDAELFPGIEVMLSPGHTLGGQSVVVNTKKGRYAISGFCAVYHNFYPPEEFKKAMTRYPYPVIPSGIHINSTMAYDSTLKLVQMFGERVLPLHEQALMKVDRIPE